MKLCRLSWPLSVDLMWVNQHSLTAFWVKRVVYDMPGTTRIRSIFRCSVTSAVHHIDTAGVRRRGRIGEAVESFSGEDFTSREDANVVLVVIDTKTITDQDLNLIGFALNAGVLSLLP